VGASASDIRAGAAYYELSARDGLTPALTKAKATAEAFGHFLSNFNPGAGGAGFFNRLVFGAKDVDARTGKYVGRVGGLVAPLRAVFSPGAGGSGLLNRMLFGDKVVDAKSGEFLQRAGGLVGPLRSAFAPLGGVINRALYGDKTDAGKGYANRARGLIGTLTQVFGSGSRGSGLVNSWLFGDKRFDQESGKFVGRIGGLVPLALGAGGAMTRAFSGASKAAHGLADGIGRSGSMLLKVGAGTAGVGAAGVAAFKPAFDAIAESGKIADLADVFGLSGEKASRLFGIMGAGGSDLRDAQEGLATFKQRLTDALTGTGEEAKKLFQELGVSAESFQGLDIADQFTKLIGAVKDSKSALGPLNLLMKAVGEDTGKNLSGVLSMTADQMKALGDQFEQSGADLQASRQTTRAYALAVASLGRVWREVAAAIAPALSALAGIATQVLKPVVAWIKENKTLVAVTLAAAGGIAAVGAALVGVGLGAVVISTAFGGLVAIGGLVLKVLAAIAAVATSPWTLAAAAVAGLTYAFLKYTDTGKAFTAQVKGQVAALREQLRPALEKTKEAFGAFANAIQKGDFAGAWEVVAAGAEAVWTGMLAKLGKAWDDFTRSVEDKFDDIFGGLGPVIDAVGQDLSALFRSMRAEFDQSVANVRNLWEGIKSVFKSGVDYIAGLWERFGPTIMRAIEPIKPLLVALAAPFVIAFKLIESAWDGMSGNIMENIVTLGSWIERVWKRVGAAVENTFKDAMQAVLKVMIQAGEKIDAVLKAIGGAGLGDTIEAMKKNLDGLKERRDGDAEANDITKRRDEIILDIREKREAAKKARAGGDEQQAQAADKAAAEAVDRLNAAIENANKPGPAAPPFGGRPDVPIIPNVTVRGAFASDMLSQQLGAGRPQDGTARIVTAVEKNSPEAIGKAVSAAIAAALAVLVTAGN
jgi:hypothetical protein